MLFADEGSASDTPSGIQVLLPAPYDLIWSAVVLVLLGLFFFRYLMPRMNKILDERTEKIEGGLAQAQTAQAEAAAAKAQQAEELAAVRAQVGQMRESAAAEGTEILNQAKAKATAEANRIVEAAQRQLEAERAAAVVSLRGEVGGLATELASRIVGESLADSARQSRVIDRFLDDLDVTLASGSDSSSAPATTQTPAATSPAAASNPLENPSS